MKGTERYGNASSGRILREWENNLDYQRCKTLMAQGKTVGVVTNDKGKHLVDTAFFRSSAIPTAEVAGGCFRCNYDELEKRLNELEEASHPDVIFAESVGSCADMAATVLQPMLEYLEKSDNHTSFSVFCDVRLLRMWLMGRSCLFRWGHLYF